MNTLIDQKKSLYLSMLSISVFFSNTWQKLIENFHLAMCLICEKNILSNFTGFMKKILLKEMIIFFFSDLFSCLI